MSMEMVALARLRNSPVLETLRGNSRDEVGPSGFPEEGGLSSEKPPWPISVCTRTCQVIYPEEGGQTRRHDDRRIYHLGRRLRLG